MNNNPPQPHSQHSQTQSPSPASRSPSSAAPGVPRLSRVPSVPIVSDNGSPAGYNFSHRGSYDASPYFSPQAAQAPSYFGNQPHQSAYPESQPSQQYFSQPTSYEPQQDDMARLRNRPQVNYNDDYQTNEFNDRVPPQQRVPLQPQPIAAREPQQQFQQPLPANTLPSQPQPTNALPSQPQQPDLSQIEVKTKFPVARIKRIMQTDEDIGKVAQATPTAVAKALELFMIDLVTKGAKNAKEQNSKRVTAAHLKNSLLADSQYDFLNEICENVADENVKKPRAKARRFLPVHSSW